MKRAAHAVHLDTSRGKAQLTRVASECRRSQTNARAFASSTCAPLRTWCTTSVRGDALSLMMASQASTPSTGTGPVLAGTVPFATPSTSVRYQSLECSMPS